MKILYDHQIFQEQEIGGISRYFCEIFKGLREINDVNIDLALGYSRNQYLKASAFAGKFQDNLETYYDFLQGHDFVGKWSLYRLISKIRRPVDFDGINKNLSIAALKAQDFDIFHPTYYDDYFLPYIGSKPFVLTVYDMIHEIYPEYFNLADRTSARKRNLAQKASKIIAISECTKRDLMQFFDIPDDKITVIHLATSMDCSSNEYLGKRVLPDRYLLFVGSRAAYKNFFFMLNGLKTILNSDPSLHIVCTGSPFNRNEKSFLEQHSISDRVHSYPASDDELKELYKSALLFIFPSLYEGFGLPVLEAFSCGCPALLSNVSSLPEIAGDAAEYFEPKDVDSLQNSVSNVIYSEERRSDLVSRGRVQAQTYSWNKTSRETELLYRQVFDSNARA